MIPRLPRSSSIIATWPPRCASHLKRCGRAPNGSQHRADSQGRYGAVGARGDAKENDMKRVPALALLAAAALILGGCGDSNDPAEPDQHPTTHESPGEDGRSEEHTSELQSRGHLVCRLLLEKKNP